MGLRNRVSDVMHMGAASRIRTNDPCVAAIRPYFKLLRPLVADVYFNFVVFISTVS